MTPAQRQQAIRKRQLAQGRYRGAGTSRTTGQTPSQIQAVRIDPVKVSPVLPPRETLPPPAEISNNLLPLALIFVLLNF